MKKIILTMFGTLIICAGCKTSMNRVSDSAELKAFPITAEAVDMGKIKVGSEFDPAYIEFKNSSDQDVPLYYITTGVCPCILAVQNDALVPAHGAVKAKLSFSPSKSMSGTYSFKVTAYTNLKEEPMIIVPVSVDVVNPDFKPLVIDRFLIKGCKDCLKAEPAFARVKAEHPYIQYKDFYSDSEKDVKYIHDKCVELNVPKDQQMDAPMVFLGDRFIGNKNINYQSLNELVIESNK